MSSPDLRQERRLAIAKMNVIAENADGSFSVPSQSVGEIVYLVKVVDGGYVCNCPDFIQRRDAIGVCKHIHATKFWIAAQVELREKPKPKVFADDAVQCAKCGSIRVIKYGRSAGKQVFKCQDCQSKFREGLMKGAKYSPEMVSLTLDLYFSGMSLRKIARTVNGQYGLNMGGASVYRWIQRYVPMVSAYVNSLTPRLSGTWHADEVFVNMKDGQKYKIGMAKKGGSIAFLWNVMDRKTRFLLASKLSKFRDVAGADRAFREAIKNANGSQPETIFTDALRSYGEAISLWPHGQRPKHIAKAGLKKPNATNNRIERLNGTVRERVKVQRGWKSMQTPIAEGFRIHYNFVKPHKALDGQTPAQVAGIGVEGENRWLELLTKAITTQGETP